MLISDDVDCNDVIVSNLVIVVVIRMLNNGVTVGSSILSKSFWSKYMMAYNGGLFQHEPQNISILRRKYFNNAK